MNLSKIVSVAPLCAGILSLGLLGLAGCGGGGGGSPDGGNGSGGAGGTSGGGGGAGGSILPGNELAGKIGGVAWTVGTVQTNSLRSSFEQYGVDAFGTTFTACSGSAPASASSLLLNLPKTPGTYRLSLDLPATFHVGGTGGTDVVATTGSIIVESVTSALITAAVDITVDADNSVDGKFEATVCP